MDVTDGTSVCTKHIGVQDYITERTALIQNVAGTCVEMARMRIDDCNMPSIQRTFLPDLKHNKLVEI